MSVSPSTKSPASAVGRAGVSVIIPTYNYARYLRRAIDSVLAQSYQNLEIIVIDDGSTDETRALVATYGEAVIYHYQANAGLSAARNAGIGRARHDFLAFLDADDEWLPDFVRLGMEILAGLPPDYGMVAASARYIDAEGNSLAEIRNDLNIAGEISVRDILFRTRFPADSVIVKRAVFGNCGMFDMELRSSEDRDMWIRIGARFRIYLVPDQLALIRRHGQSMINNVERMKTNMRRVIRKSYRAGLVPRGQIFFWLQVLAVYHYQTSLMFKGAGQGGPALRDILASFICWPGPLNPRQIDSRVHVVRLRTLAAIVRDGLARGR